MMAIIRTASLYVMAGAILVSTTFAVCGRKPVEMTTKDYVGMVLIWPVAVVAALNNDEPRACRADRPA